MVPSHTPQRQQTMQAIQTLYSCPQDEPEHLHNVEDLPLTLCPPSAKSAMVAQALYDPRLLLMMVPLSAPHSPEAPFSDRVWVPQGQFALFFHLWLRHDLLLIQEGFLVDKGTPPRSSELSQHSRLCSHLLSESQPQEDTDLVQMVCIPISGFRAWGNVDSQYKIQVYYLTWIILEEFTLFHLWEVNNLL